jgi:hypothetical protein
MSQSLLYHAFGVREGYEYRSTKYVEGRVEFHLAVKDESIHCPHCQGREYRWRGRRKRRFNTLPIGSNEMVWVVEVPKFECLGCGKNLPKQGQGKPVAAQASETTKCVGLQRAALESQ